MLCIPVSKLVKTVISITLALECRPGPVCTAIYIKILQTSEVGCAVFYSYYIVHIRLKKCDQHFFYVLGRNSMSGRYARLYVDRTLVWLTLKVSYGEYKEFTQTKLCRPVLFAIHVREKNLILTLVCTCR